nr:fasciclin-1 isoform X1 [Crassostrea gigas]|eukprot:XP_011435844.1 PREDICTED: fasciclin-1 isoform X1 [Crassostrea gigas]
MERCGAILRLLISIYLVNYVNGQLISGNVLQILQRTTGFSKFAQLVVRAQLTRLYESPTSLTLFAFNDTAYNNLPYKERNVIDSYSVKDLADYIKFCTIPGNRLQTSAILDNQYVRSSDANGDRLFFNRIQRLDTTSSGSFGPVKFYVNGVEISEGTNRDISATNGVVHGLNGVMRKTSQSTAYGWIQEPEDSIQRFTQFTDLMSYLHTFENINDLSSPDKITTFFVPNDNAMQKIPLTQLNRLRNDPMELQRILQAHYIPNRAVFTNCISHNEGATNAKGLPITFRKPSGYNVYVNSDGVSAAIIEGNITVSNGVVHIVDQLLGFVYNNIREQIQQESTKFEQMINLGTETVKNSLVQPSGVTVFVPLDSAFQKVANIRWANLNSNQTLVDMVLRLHILQPNNMITISSLPGLSGYESRMYRQTLYSNERLTIYNERNETWVQGGNVKARVIRPDIKTVNGMVHIIDSLLGIPYLDLPMLICSDVWLLRTYDYMRRVGLKNYLTDRRFTAEKCSFEIYGYPQNYGSAVTQNTGSQSSQCSNCYMPQYQNSYPCNSALCANTNTGGGTTCPGYCQQQQYANTQQCMQCNTNTNTNCPDYCKQQQYANQQVCMQCNGGGTSQCPSTYISYCSNPANANVSPCNAYPCNMLNGMNTGSQSTSAYDLGFCGTTAVACDFTVFVPNSSAIDYFSVTNNGYRVMRDTPRFQWLFKRLILPGRLYIEKIGNGNHQMKMMNGELVTLTKNNDRDVRIYFGGASSNVIHMDEGATNGVIHIIDQLLFVNEDLTRDVSSARLVTFSLWLLLGTIFIARWLLRFMR